MYGISYNYLPYKISSSAVIIAVITGVVMPLISNIIPIRKALSK